ncbi:MAG: hypothetical protein AB2A00_29740 [Myxococcota bacterium]
MDEEGLEWLRTLLPVIATAFTLPGAAVEDVLARIHETDEERLRKELQGEVGVFMRGLVLLAAASEAVVDVRPLPAAIVEWCDESFLAVQAAVRALRARGIPLPFEVTIPGFTPKQWRERWAARTFQDLSDEAAAELTNALQRRPRYIQRTMTYLLDTNAVSAWLEAPRLKGNSKRSRSPP